MSKEPAEREHGHTHRGRMLLQALGLVERDRNSTYGPPTEDFRRTSGVLNALGYSGPGGRAILPHDTAVIANAIKLSRLSATPSHFDSWVDQAGYAACGWECVVDEKDRGEMP